MSRAIRTDKYPIFYRTMLCSANSVMPCNVICVMSYINSSASNVLCLKCYVALYPLLNHTIHQSAYKDTKKIPHMQAYAGKF